MYLFCLELLQKVIYFGFRHKVGRPHEGLPFEIGGVCGIGQDILGIKNSLDVVK